MHKTNKTRVISFALTTAATAALATLTSSPCLAQQSGGAYLLPPMEASRIVEDRVGGIYLYSKERYSIPTPLLAEDADYVLLLRDTTHVMAEATINLTDNFPWGLSAVTGPIWSWPGSFQVQHSFQLDCGSGAFPVETDPVATYPVIGSEPGMMTTQYTQWSSLTHRAEHAIPWHSPCRRSLNVIRRNQANVDLYDGWKVMLRQNLDAPPRFQLAKIPNPKAGQRLRRLLGEFRIHPGLWDQVEDVAVRDRMNAFLADDALEDHSIVDFLRNDVVIQADPSRFSHLINVIRIPIPVHNLEPIPIHNFQLNQIPNFAPIVGPFNPAQ